MRSKTFLVSASPVSMERVLRVTLGGIMAAASGAAVNACGACPKLPPPTTYTVTFTMCEPDAGGEAGNDAEAATDADTDAAVADAATDAAPGDASTDAGDAGKEDSGTAGQCFSTCEAACAALGVGTLGDSITCSMDASSGPVTVTCEAQIRCVGGRRLDGLEGPKATSTAGATPRAAMLANLAWLEAASISAFRRLARELRAHGAPRALILRAKASARDEARHARLMSKLATKHGASVPRVTIRDVPVRSLESIARENAVEGCVMETYGALTAAWDATHEPDPEIADAMSQIAPDELRHAALGWAVAAWANERLSPAARKRVRAARNAAALALVAETPTKPESILASKLMEQVVLA